MPHEIDSGRVITGVIAGEASLVLGLAAFSGPAFPIVLLVGTILAVLAAVLFLWPAYALLKVNGQLKIWWVLILGAAIVTVSQLVSNLFVVAGYSEGSGYYSNGVWLIEDGRLTTEGWLRFFVTGPVYSMPFGVAAAFIGWTAAFRLRLEPPRHSAEAEST